LGLEVVVVDLNFDLDFIVDNWDLILFRSEKSKKSVDFGREWPYDFQCHRDHGRSGFLCGGCDYDR
jgi:hypothetical protein